MNNQEIHIIIADDHALFSEGLANLLLKNINIRIDKILYNGSDLIAYLKSDVVLPDILILDINMPNTNGLACLEFINEHKLNLSVIVVSMSEEYTVVKKSLASGALGFLPKNAGHDDLMEAIHAVLNKKIYISRSLAFDVNAVDYSLLFSKREIQVLELLAQGLSSKLIASKLNISFNTVETHRKNLLKKADENTTAGLIKFAFENKLIS